MTADKAWTNLNQQKRSTASMTEVQAVALNTVFVPQADNRVSLRFLPHATVPYSVSLLRTIIGAAGLVIPAGGLPVDVTLGEQGAMVKGPWFLVTGAVPNTFAFIEAINQES